MLSREIKGQGEESKDSKRSKRERQPTGKKKEQKSNYLQSLLRKNHITNSEYVNVNINKENHIKKQFVSVAYT